MLGDNAAAGSRNKGADHARLAIACMAGPRFRTLLSLNGWGSWAIAPLGSESRAAVFFCSIRIELNLHRTTYWQIFFGRDAGFKCRCVTVTPCLPFGRDPCVRIFSSEASPHYTHVRPKSCHGQASHINDNTPGCPTEKGLSFSAWRGTRRRIRFTRYHTLVAVKQSCMS
jgi:hypothetical protein